MANLILRSKRGIYSTNGGSPLVVAQATIEEKHNDELEITSHPIQLGANITDHAFKHPPEVVVQMGFSNSGYPGLDIGNIFKPQSALNGADVSQANNVYKNLLDLQEKRILVSLFTGKRSYTNMLIKGIAETTDYKTENSLIITVSFQNVIIVQTESVQLSKETQKTPAETTSTKNVGSKQLRAAPDFTVKR
jgi:hypothetical protein